MFRIKRSVSEVLDRFPVCHVFQILIVHDFDLLNFVRSSEAVEEMYERNSAFDRCEMSNAGQIHDFLNGA